MGSILQFGVERLPMPTVRRAECDVCGNDTDTAGLRHLACPGHPNHWMCLSCVEAEHLDGWGDAPVLAAVLRTGEIGCDYDRLQVAIYSAIQGSMPSAIDIAAKIREAADAAED